MVDSAKAVWDTSKVDGSKVEGGVIDIMKIDVSGGRAQK